MPPKKTQQNTKAAEFMKVTGITDKNLAEKYLKESNGDINDAVENYFNSGGGNKAVPQISPAEIVPEFAKYNDGGDKMMERGVSAFFADAGLDMEDIIVFIFSHAAKATTMGEFTKDEWVRGMSTLGVRNSVDFGKQANSIRDQYKRGSSQFNEVFKFIFTFYSGSKKSIPGAEAGFLLSIAGKGYPLCTKLSTYLSEDAQAKSESIFKDTWNMIHHLLKNTDASGNGYNDQDAWPLLIVNFMESVKK